MKSTTMLLLVLLALSAVLLVADLVIGYQLIHFWVMK